MSAVVFEIRRITVIKVAGDIDAVAVSQLRRMAQDMIVDHGESELLLDLTAATDPKTLLPSVVDEITGWIGRREGTIEFRLPSAPPIELTEATNDSTIFVPLPPDPG